jgi:class 3 adenylate cyclase
VEGCAACGAPVGTGDRFCGECGAALVACPSCGEPVIPGKRFCRACGSALTDAAAPALPATPAGPAGRGRGPVAERRLCSVLFCDLVGFTPLSESRDPEAVRELLSQYFSVARTVIGRYGGVVEKFIGDAVMAVWGTSAATEGDAERAVRAGLELVATVEALGAEAGAAGLAARAGVVSGEVAVTLGAAGEGMVAGDAVNTASRVQAAAGPGQVLVDLSTRRLAESAIEFAAAGVHPLKGKAQPQPLWRAARVLSGVGGSQRIDGLEAPLTGRDAELRTIKELFHATAERKLPRLVLVSGPAGVGKSRLGWEFEKYVDGLAESVRWYRGRCLSYGDGVAFWALAEIVRVRLRIAEEDPAETAAAKLAEDLGKLIVDPAERAYIGARPPGSRSPTWPAAKGSPSSAPTAPARTGSSPGATARSGSGQTLHPTRQSSPSPTSSATSCCTARSPTWSPQPPSRAPVSARSKPAPSLTSSPPSSASTLPQSPSRTSPAGPEPTLVPGQRRPSRPSPPGSSPPPQLSPPGSTPPTPCIGSSRHRPAARRAGK